ncbi:MAG: hypothetical protein M3Y91_04565 [Actinomycetota bacterium]|nr:hypothetical protein [Actinomycetota bacterium]
MATTTNHSPKSTEDLAATLRGHAEASIKDVQELATATADHSREVTSALGRSAVDSVTRSSDVALEAWKAWSAAASATVATVNVSEVFNASFEAAGGVLDAQRKLAQRLVGAAAPATR